MALKASFGIDHVISVAELKIDPTGFLNCQAHHSRGRRDHVRCLRIETFTQDTEKGGHLVFFPPALQQSIKAIDASADTLRPAVARLDA
jgi:hypothetical protein